jgi:hypothetical protein
MYNVRACKPLIPPGFSHPTKVYTETTLCCDSLTLRFGWTASRRAQKALWQKGRESTRAHNDAFVSVWCAGVALLLWNGKRFAKCANVRSLARDAIRQESLSRISNMPDARSDDIFFTHTPPCQFPTTIALGFRRTFIHRCSCTGPHSRGEEQWPHTRHHMD